MKNTAEKTDAFFAEYVDNYPKFAEDFVRIRTRHQTIEPLKLNKAQRICHKILEKQKAEKKYVRAIILKARRLGMSTYTEGRFYHRATMWPLQNVYIVSHRDDSCDVLFGMAKLMQEKNPLHPGTIASNRKELRFKATRSEYGFSSADSPDAAKSRDITLFHGSEVAAWRDAPELLGALLPCIPKPPTYSEAILESTAEGYGNLFQKMAFEAFAEGKNPYYEEDGYTYAYHNPGYEWILIFFPWFTDPQNSMQFFTEDEKSEFKRMLERPQYREDLGVWGQSPEWELMGKYGLTLEQMNWRAWTLKNDCQGNLNKFRQEYPATVFDAFVSTGGNVFPTDVCDQLEVHCKPYAHRGELVDRSGRVVVRRATTGRLCIWDTPELGEDYLISIDPAGGVRELQNDKNAADYTCMDVWKRKDRFLVQVAQWHGHINYDLIGNEAILLARLYNNAAISVLRMNHGLSVLTVLLREEWPRIVNDEDGKPGILEDRKRKPGMVDELVRDTRDGIVHLVSTETVSELRTYIERDRKMGAEDGCKDDRVSSAYCAVHSNYFLPRPAAHHAVEYPRAVRKQYGEQQGTVHFKNFPGNRRDETRRAFEFEVDD